MLGWVAATGDLVEAGTLFFSFFGNFHIFGLLVGFYMKIMKSRFFYVAYRQKIKVLLYRLFIYGLVVIASLLPSLGYTGSLYRLLLQLFFYWVFGFVWCSYIS
jgi:hypothetical protein